MLKYLVILLDDASVSFCHYGVKKEKHVIDEGTLKQGITFAMKENLSIQFVYPGYELPGNINALVETIDHTKIKPAACRGGADVVVYGGMEELRAYPPEPGSVCVLRTGKDELFAMDKTCMATVLNTVARFNIVIKDAETFTEDDFAGYKALLAEWAEIIKGLYAGGKSPQLNVLTDRIMLDAMNNCGAGDEVLTLAPDGKFYVCPAFHQEGLYDVGNLKDGLDVKNPQLYKLDHAPICRTCDAYQCKRCIYLNRKTTLEVNTPGHEQCVIAHLERNAARRLLAGIRDAGEFMPGKEIKEIDYLDPFDKIKR